MPKTQVAVEITEESVRAIEVSLGRTPTVVAAGEVPVPPGAAKDSEVLDRDAVAVALQRLWAEARISQRNVVLGVGNRRILVREHSTQLTNPAQIRQALPFEVQDRLPVPVDQAVLDFVPTAQDDRGVHGLLVAAVAEHMEELVGALDKARLRPLSIDLVAFGYARALATLVEPGRTGLLVGIGEHTTHIVIATDGVPRFVRVVPLDIVDAAPPDEPAPASEPLRRRRAATVESDARDALSPAVQTALIDLVGRLRSTVAFYRDRANAAPIDIAFVTGTHAAHPRLVEAIATAAGAPVTPVSVSDLVPAAPGLALPVGTAARLTGAAALLQGGVS